MVVPCHEVLTCSLATKSTPLSSDTCYLGVMPPQHDGDIWYWETLTLLEQKFHGGRLDYLAVSIREQVVADHKLLGLIGLKRRPRVSPEMVVRAALSQGFITEAEALKHLRWHRKEKTRLEARGNVPHELRCEVFARDGRICQYCGGHGDTLDHLKPVSKGGTATRFNLLTACRSCNAKKHVSELSEETVKVIKFFLKRERTVANGYPHMTELVRQFFEQLEKKKPFEQARIRAIVGIKKVGAGSPRQ